MNKNYFLWPIAFITGLYTTFVIQQCWNWFVMPLLGLPNIAFWEMFGLTLIIHLITNSKEDVNEYRWETVMTVLDACVPEHKMEELKSVLKFEENSLSSLVLNMIFNKVCGNTFVLLAAWLISTFFI